MVTLGGGASLRLEPASYCPPVPIEVIHDEAPTRIFLSVNEPAPSRLETPNARLVIRADGSVEDVRLDGSSGLAQLDQIIFERTRRRTYQPALLDGLPVSVTMKVRSDGCGRCAFSGVIVR